MKKSVIAALFFSVITLCISDSANSQSGYNGGIQVGQGEYVTFFIDNNGTLTAIGNRGYTGVGGNGSSGSAGASGIPEPVIVSPSNLKFKHAAGHFHGGAAVDVNGFVWTMGTAVAGESGMGNTNYSQYPQKILTDINGNTFDSVVAVIAYAQSSDEQAEQHGWLALKSTGTLWIWGTPGAMRGNGTEDLYGRVLRPARIIIPGGRSVKQVAGGDYITALCTDGTVWTWGNTYRANLGYIYSGMEYASPHQINISGVAQIAGGKEFNYALKSTGELYGWGLLGNYMNDLTWPEGTGPEITFPTLVPNIQNYLPAPISKIVTSFSISAALLTDGSLWTWGDNTQGCIGNGESYYGNPTNGYAWDYSIHLLRKIPYHVAPTRTFKNVFAGNTLCFYTYALGTDDQLYSWGTNRGSVIANRINMPVTGNLNFYDNSWNRPWPQPVNPFNITTDFISTSPICLNDPSSYPCNTYAIPANTKPTANAGPNQSVSGSSATLDGRASTDNVFISYYLWSQVSGPNTAVIDLPASPTPKVSSLVTGTYVFKLKTTDNGWFSDSATVQVSVNTAANQPPIANAGANQIITLPVSNVNLAGSGTDPDGNIASYAWTQVSGTAATIVNPALAATNITGLTTAGIRVFRLTVTDNQGATGTSDITITVNPAASNSKPIPGKIEAESFDTKSGGMYGIPTSDAGGGQHVIGISNGSWMDYNVNVTQSGVYTVNFRIATAHSNSQFQIKSGNTILATINIPNTGGWDTWVTVPFNNISLTAGAQTIRILSTSNETCNFNWMDWVLAGGSQLPTANAGSPQTISLPTNQVTLNGAATAGTGGSIVSHVWSKFSGGSATITDPNNYGTTVTGLSAGTYTFRLTVTQNDNQIATSDVTITVNASAPAGKTIPGRIEAESYDNKSGPLYAIATTDAGGGQHVIGINNDSWMDYNVNVTQSGVYTVNFRVATAQSNSQFQIKSGNTVLATINIPNTGGWDTWVTVPFNNISLTAGAQTIRILSISNETCNFNWMDWVLAGGSQLPTANAGSPQTISLPTNQVTLNGAATPGTGGSIVSHVWSKFSGGSATITDPNNYGTTVTGLSAGTYIFRLTVTQNDNQTATSDVVITVNASVPAGKTIPGRIEAESYDSKSGPLYAIATADAGGGQHVIGINNGSWMDYNVNVTQSGVYTVNFRVATAQSNSQFQIKSGNTILSTINIPNTGGWDTWLTVPFNNVSLPAGAQTIRILSISNETCNFNWMDWVLAGGSQLPTANAGLPQTISLPTNQVTLNGAGTAGSGGTIISHVWSKFSGGSATITDPNNYGTTVTGLSAGTYIFRLTVTQNDNQIATSDVTITVNASAPAGKTIPGKIEAESFDTKSGGMYGIPTSDAGGGQHVIGISNGSWTDYNVNVTQTGIYTVNFRIATTHSNAQFQVKLGATVLGTFNIPNTGGWDTWVTVPLNNVSLIAGAQTIRILSTKNETCNFNWMDWVLNSPPVTANTIVSPVINERVTVNAEKPLSAPSLEIFPNPVTDQFVLKINNNYAGVIKVQIVDQGGNIIRQMQATKNKGLTYLNLSTTAMPAGLYSIRVQTGGQSNTIKMMKL